MKTPQAPLANIDPRRTSLLSNYNFAKNNTLQSHDAIIRNNKESNIIYQNTNCTATPQDFPGQPDIFNEDNSQNAISFFQAKRMINDLHQMRVQEESNTLAVGWAHAKQQKIRIIATDEEPTQKASQMIKAAINCQIKKQAAVILTEKKQAPSKQKKKRASHAQVGEDDVTLKIEIPANKKVEQIFQKQPLRKRFSALLKDEQKYEIGHHHMKLLNMLKSIDRTIDFVCTNRKIRSYFYADLKKNIYENCRTELTQRHIQQMLFIDDQLFKVEWALNQKIKYIDLLITLPVIRSEDQRIQKARKNIVEYLLAMEVQFLSKTNAEKVKVDGWTDGFDPNKYQIPMKSFPPHPLNQSAELRGLSQTRVNSIQNPNLRELIMDKKEEQDAKSLRSEQVASIIFGKKSNISIKEKLFQAIKDREAKQAQYSTNEVRLDNEMLVKVCDEIMVTYMGKGVTNIFKSTMIEILNKRLSYKTDQIMVCLDVILQTRQIQFLKQVTTSSKVVVLQINKSKFDSMKSYLKGKKVD